MRIRNLDSNWDWTFGQSQLNYATKQNAIILDIKMKLKEWQNDCFFALQNGIAWDIRLGSKNQKALLDKDVVRVVQSVEGVFQITDFESTVIERRYRATFSVYTEYSTNPIQIKFDSNEGVLQ